MIIRQPLLGAKKTRLMAGLNGVQSREGTTFRHAL
jgi:hypothetical protein